MLVIDIDYREQKILKLIDPTITNIYVSDTVYGPVTHGSKVVFYYKISNLIIGDFIYRNSQIVNETSQETNETTQVTNEISQETNESNDASSVYCIIERKSISDLASSIKDGRYREQKERLSQSNANIIYMIEGNINTLRGNGICKTTLKSSIINLQLKHKYLVFKTDSESDSFEYLLLLYKKIQENNGIDFNKSENVTFKKKDSMSSVYINQLTMINGVSKAIALKIAEKYKSLIILINTYNSITDNKLTCENLLSDIQITDKRKLGKALSKKIFNALIETDSEHSERVLSERVCEQTDSEQTVSVMSC
jgi:crossover junction endonuclease MUS81